MNMRIQGCTEIFMAEQYTWVNMRIQGSTGVVYMGEHENTGVYRG